MKAKRRQQQRWQLPAFLPPLLLLTSPGFVSCSSSTSYLAAASAISLEGESSASGNGYDQQEFAVQGSDVVPENHSSGLTTSNSISSISSQMTLGEDHGADHRSLAVYALYNLPPFAVTLKTVATPELKAQQQEGAPLFVSSGKPQTTSSTTSTTTSLVSSTLKTVTQNVLEEEFMKEINDAGVSEAHEEPLADGVLPEIFLHLVAVDLQVKMNFGDEDMIRRRLRRLESGASSEENQIARRQLVEHITLVAEMYGTVAFLEPHEHKYKPTNEQVREIFGEWMTNYFKNHRDVYLTKLVQSEQQVLKDIIKLEIQTNIDEMDEDPTVITSEGWSSRTERAMLLIMIVIAVMAITWLILFFHHKGRKRMERIKFSYSHAEHDMNNDDTMVFVGSPSGSQWKQSTWSPTGGVQADNRNRAESMDAVRHGRDVHYNNASNGARSILEASDRYLSKHRPDLFETLNRGSSGPRSTAGEDSGEARSSYFGGFGSFSSFGYNTDEQSTSSAASHFFSGPSSRKYVIPSNPFEYIYSAASAFGSYQRPQESTEQSAMESTEQRRASLTPRRSSLMALNEQRENIAAKAAYAHEEYPDDERYYEEETGLELPEHTGYRPISTIWRNISSMMTNWDADGGSMRSSQDGLKYLSEDEQTGLDLSQFQQYQDNPEEEEEDNYDFPFQDFPRHDGTPCVMYDENGERRSQNKFVIGSCDEDDELSDSKISPTTPVSNGTFQRMLSQHSIMEDVEFDDDKFLKATSFEEDEEDIQTKLNRHLAQRQRVYEKKAIMDKHREARDKERKEQREYERRERHYAMESEIEKMEAFSPLATRGKKSSATHKKDTSYRSDHHSAPHSPTNQYIQHYNHRRTGSSSSASSQYRNRHTQSPKSPMPHERSPLPHKSPIQNDGAFSPMRSNMNGQTSNSPFRISSADRSRASPSPIKQGSAGIFRTASNDGSVASSGSSARHQAVLQNVSSTESTRSISPPGGLEGGEAQLPARVPTPDRNTHVRNHSWRDDVFEKVALKVETDPERLTQSVTNFENQEADIDALTLSKLSLPTIGNDGKHPSPNSVMDELISTTPPSFMRKALQRHGSGTNKNNFGGAVRLHRRVNSFGNSLEDHGGRGMDDSSHGASLGEKLTMTPVRKHNQGRVNNGQQELKYYSHLHQQRPPNQQSQHRRTNSRGHSNQQQTHPLHQKIKRTNSNDIRRTISHGHGSGGGSHSRSNSVNNIKGGRHSRSNSLTDPGVVTHGIYAHTRFS